MRRVPQRALLSGFHKVHYFGLWHPAQRYKAARVRQMLQLRATPKVDPPPDFVVPSPVPSSAEPAPSIEPLIYPRCQGRRLIFTRTLSRARAMALRGPSHPRPRPTCGLVVVRPSTPWRSVAINAIGTPRLIQASPSAISKNTVSHGNAAVVPQVALAEPQSSALIRTGLSEISITPRRPRASPCSPNGASAPTARRENS